MVLKKGKIVGFRVDEDRLGQYARAADRQGKRISDWLRDLANAAVGTPRESSPRVEPRALMAPAEKNVKNANGIGLDANAFLAALSHAAPPVPLAGLPPDEEELDDEDSIYLDKLNHEFGPQKLLQAAKAYRQSWERMTPRQQYELLCELKERAS